MLWQDQVLRQLSLPRTLLDLFDTIPGVYLYIKDVESCFVRAKRVVCDVVGVGHSDELIGPADFTFSARYCCAIRCRGSIRDHDGRVTA